MGWPCELIFCANSHEQLRRTTYRCAIFTENKLPQFWLRKWRKVELSGDWAVLQNPVSLRVSLRGRHINFCANYFSTHFAAFILHN